MPDPGPQLSGPVVIGLYGKMPAHGDFVRRALPGSFIAPWDAWIAAGIAAARDRLGEDFAAAWDVAPAWRFTLPAGTCGPDAVAGVMLPSADTVGRRFPLTVAALLPRGRAPEEAWFAGIETRAREAREGVLDADGLTHALSAGLSGDASPLPVLPEETLLGLFGDEAATLPPVSDATASPAEAAPDETWRDLLDGEGTAPPPQVDPSDDRDEAPPAEAWLDLLGQEGVAEPGTDAAETEGQAAPPPAEAWLDLLGGDGQQDSSLPGADPATPAEPAAEAWRDMLGDEGAAGDAETPDEDGWKALLDTPAAETKGRPPEDSSAAPLPSEPVQDVPSALFGQVPPPEASTPSADPPGAGLPPQDAAGGQSPLSPPERPGQGGWWTLGGGRLPAMVWAFPALPPPEAFVLLLETKA